MIEPSLLRTPLPAPRRHDVARTPPRRALRRALATLRALLAPRPKEACC